MTGSPDALVVLRWGDFVLNGTIVYTWILMLVLTGASLALRRRLSRQASISPWQSAIEALVIAINKQIHEISGDRPERYLPFVGTLFLFIAGANLAALLPGFHSPTASLSTATALALCVLFAVPIFGVGALGLRGYLRSYLQPNFLMLPFNVITELSRTVALAMRLYGNIMSGTLVVAVLLSLTPYLFPIVMQLFGLLTGMIQAYIFAVLAMVYIAAATTTQKHNPKAQSAEKET